MTIHAHQDAHPTKGVAATAVTEAGDADPPAPEDLLPSATPVRFLDDHGLPAGDEFRGDFAHPDEELLVETYRRMVIGRRFDAQATALTKQGRLAVYPSSHGQEACEVAAVLALRDTDWLFPTYRDTMALITRDIDVVEALTLLRGEWHCGYDPMTTRTAPQCTPLATHLPHAAGLAYAARRRGEDTVALAFVGDGGTSEGDFHEALNFAAVFGAPVVFVVQNNGFAISVPLSRQTAAPTLAHKGVGYGIASEQVDGNDPVAVLAVVDAAVARARETGRPMLVEAHTYRIEAHTNADDATRYRDGGDVEKWVQRDPVRRLQHYLSTSGALTDDAVAGIEAEAESFAADVRQRLATDADVEADELFQHVFAEPTAQIEEQRRWRVEDEAGDENGDV